MTTSITPNFDSDNNSDKSREINYISILENIGNSLKPCDRNEFVDFVTNNNIIPNLLPVTHDKMVTTGGASSTSCRMTANGLNTLLDTFGMWSRVEGVNDNEDETKVIKAGAVALQNRFETLTLDLDCNLFPISSSELPVDLLIWVARYHEKALKVQGNRVRMTLVFKISSELLDYLRKTGTHKKNYTLTCGVRQLIEIGYGNVNATLYGFHPSAKQYQQLFPVDDKLGEIGKEEFDELLEILEKNSHKNTHRSGTATSNGRYHIDDCDTYLVRLSHYLNWIRENRIPLYDSASIPFDLSISIKDFLNPEVKEVIDGNKYFNGNDYVESDDDFAIPATGRYYSYFNVGSDVHLISEICERCEIDYDEGEIDDIVDELWEHTDSDGDGSKGSKFSENDALSAFNMTSGNVTVKYDYLQKVITQLLDYFCTKVAEADKQLVSTRKKIREEQKSTDESPEEFNMGDSQNDSSTFDPLADDNEEILKSYESHIKEEKETSGIDEFWDAIGDSIKGDISDDKKSDTLEFEDVSENLEEELNYKEEIEKSACEDDWSIFPDELRELAQGATPLTEKLHGSSFAMLTQLFAWQTATTRYVETTNFEFNPRKKAFGVGVGDFQTRILPYTVTFAESGEGKSIISDLLATPMGIVEQVFQREKLADEVTLFKNRFTDGKGNFKKLDIDASGKPTDEMLAKMITLITEGAAVPVKTFFTFKPNYRLSDFTEAGFRNAIVSQQYLSEIRDKSDEQYFNESYLHPIVIARDEVMSIFNQMNSKDASYGCTSEFFNDRKSGGTLKISRSNFNYEFDEVGVTFAGNLVSSKMRKIVKSELEEGTDGLTPRFNISFLKSRKEEDITYSFNNTKRPYQVTVLGVMEIGRYVSAYHTHFPNSPYSNNRMVFDESAQEEYGKFLENVRVRKDRLLAKFPQYRDYINSMFGKADAELSIYATKTQELKQLLRVWNIVKQELPSMEEMSEMIGSKDIKTRKKLGEMINSAIAVALSKPGVYNWNLNVSGEDVVNGAKIVNHHYSVIEMLLVDISEQKSLSERSREALQESILSKNDNGKFKLEKLVSGAGTGIVKFLSKKGLREAFTVSDIGKYNFSIKGIIGDESLTTKLFNLLCEQNILIRDGSGYKGRPKFRLNLNISMLSEITSRITAICKGLARKN